MFNLLFVRIESIFIPWVQRMKDALLDREDCNVILVDWSAGAGLLYGQAAGNTRLVGVQIAELIRFLISSNSGSGDWAERFYIVGFSLGAQIGGYSGTNLRSTGMTLGRITGKIPEGEGGKKGSLKCLVGMRPPDYFKRVLIGCCIICYQIKF